MITADINPGPALNGQPNFSGKLPQVAASSSISDSPAAGPLNNYAPLGYVGGNTNRLILLAASGGTTFNGLDSFGVPDGFTVLVINSSQTDNLIFNHLNSGSFGQNQFSNLNGGQVAIQPLAAARCTMVFGMGWQFA